MKVSVTIHKITEDQVTDEMKRAWDKVLAYLYADDNYYEEVHIDEDTILRTMPRVEQSEEYMYEIIPRKGTKETQG